MEGCSHALWRPCPHSTGFSSRQSTDWFRGLGWEYFFGGWKIVSHVAGVGRYFLEWEILFLVWGINHWSGDFPFGVGNCRSGVGRLFLVWEISIGVGRLLLVWGTFRGLPARFYRRIEPPTVSDLAHAPTARPFLRNSWSGASFSTSDSLGTD